MCCAVVQLNMTGTLCLCELQTAGINIHCATFWVGLEKNRNKNASFGEFIYLFILPIHFHVTTGEILKEFL
jgi:hypothetical protein